eukprot:scaffold165747_cov27-Tisochrysis_lutea.AAC.5
MPSQWSWRRKPRMAAYFVCYASSQRPACAEACQTTKISVSLPSLPWSTVALALLRTRLHRNLGPSVPRALPRRRRPAAYSMQPGAPLPCGLSPSFTSHWWQAAGFERRLPAAYGALP